MNRRNTLIVAGIGFVLGFIIKDQIDRNKVLSPENALETAKELFKQSGPISGSWIYMKPLSIEKNGLNYNVYRGGITRNLDGENLEYEFYSDLKSGLVIDVKDFK